MEIDLEGCVDATVELNLLSQKLVVKDSKRVEILEPISDVARAMKLLEVTA